MMELRQSTSVTLKIGPFLDETDGKTAETGLTVTQAEVRLSKNGGDIAQKNEATSCTHDELGIYGCPIDTTDTNTLGRLQLWVHESGALPVWHEFMVLTQQAWDSKYSTDKLQVHVVEYTAGVIDAAAVATGAFDADALAADAATEIADAVLKRGVANVEATADVDSLAAGILAILHSVISGTTWTIYRTNDTTVFDTKTVTADSGADPVTGVADP